MHKDDTRDLATALAAFFDDLGDQAGKVTLVTISEFGRRVAQNDSYGLDHGYGNVMFVAGAGVRGGRYYGTMAPLSGDVDSDVPVTTDYRSVLAEILAARFPEVGVGTVFPGLTRTTLGFMSPY